MQRNRLRPEAYVAGIRAGDRGVLSRAITLIESNLPADRSLAAEVVAQCMPFTGGAFRLGITGSPGVGKSTFIDSFGAFLAASGLQVAVLAVDPSSQRTGGSILGDKTRMERLARHERAYIRPSPAGRSLGGVAANTRESLLLCEAAGFEVIIVETVGVGQSETAVHAMVDFFLLLLLPHAGDELQGFKKGIVEMADGLLINKADGDLLPKARAAKATFSQVVRLFPRESSGWSPPVMTCSAQENAGIAEVWEMLKGYREQMQTASFWEQRRQQQAIQWMEDTLRERLYESFFQHPEIRPLLRQFREEVAAGQRSPIRAAEMLLACWELEVGSRKTGDGRPLR